LFEIGPTPLNPVNWPLSIEALAGYFYRTALDIQNNWESDTRRAVFNSTLPMSAGLSLLAFVLVFRGRHWVERIAMRVLARDRSAERWIAGLAVSIGQILLPVLGLWLLTIAAQLTGLLGPRGEVFVQALPEAGFMFFAARWLGGQIFPRGDDADAPVPTTPAVRAEGRLHASVLGMVLFVAMPLRAISVQSLWSPEIVNVLNFPLIVVAGIALVRLALLLLRHAKSGPSTGSEVELRARIMPLMSRLVIILAIAGPVLAAVGYFNAGQALVYPTVSSLMLLALLVVVQKLVKEIYVLFTRNREGVNEALIPVLAGFAIVIATIPFFALIWGARVTDLLEIWGQFTEGFKIGETRISPSDFLTFIFVFVVGYSATRLLQSALRTTILPKTRLDVGGQNALVSGTGYIGIFIAALIAITSAGLDLSALAYVAGALSVGIGFGLQNIVSNFVSGIILLIERPIATGDWIEVGGQMGYVRDISVRSTRIETFDRTDVIVPNADLVSGTVTNWTRGNLNGRLIVPVGVAYGADSRRVEQILREVAEAQPQVLLNPPPFILFKGFGASSLDFEVRAILRDVTGLPSVQTEMHHQIYERLAQEGIEIPFAQQDIWLRNPETLRPAPATPPVDGAVQLAEAAKQHKADDLPGTSKDKGDADR
jgi:small-conductance mechanosensitive channel